MRGRIVSISNGIAHVCIIREISTCESCSQCPKIIGTKEHIEVAAVAGIYVGQEVLLVSNKNWVIRNRILFMVMAFILGIVITELISIMVPLGPHKKGLDLIGGSIFMAISMFIVWKKRPRYLYKIQIEKKEARYDRI